MGQNSAAGHPTKFSAIQKSYQSYLVSSAHEKWKRTTVLASEVQHISGQAHLITHVRTLCVHACVCVCGRSVTVLTHCTRPHSRNLQLGTRANYNLFLCLWPRRMYIGYLASSPKQSMYTKCV